MAKKTTQNKTNQDEVDQRLIEQLFANGILNNQGRQAALDMIYPNKPWELWIGRLLLILGITLLAAGFGYFIAYNWLTLNTIGKLLIIEIAIFLCIFSTAYFKLDTPYGRTLLLVLSLLVGIFLAAFGQLYQTGANAHNLFLVWGLVVFVFTLFSNSAMQWALWVLIANMWLMLWASPDETNIALATLPYYSAAYTVLFNFTLVGLREYAVLIHKHTWLAARWTRIAITSFAALIMFIPAATFILEASKASYNLTIGGVVAVGAYGITYYTYRFHIKDMWPVALSVFAGAVLLVTWCSKMTIDYIGVVTASEEVVFIIMALLTFVIVYMATKHLRQIQMELNVKSQGGNHAPS